MVLAELLLMPQHMNKHGKPFPGVGFGTWNVPKESVRDAIRTAIEAGYRHIDCARVYDNEKEVGDALKEIFAEGKIKRDDLWITSKLWNTFHEEKHVNEACNHSLEMLGLDYLDLYLMHWPVPCHYMGRDKIIPDDWTTSYNDDIDYKETWKGMEALYNSGKVSAIGVCNFNVAQLDDLVKSCKIKPMMLQVELHPYNQQKELVECARKHGMGITAYSPLGSPGTVDSFHTTKPQSLLEHKVITSAAEQLKTTPANVLISWSIAKGYIPIPKSSNPIRIKTNLEAANIKLDQKTVASIDAIDTQFRVVAPERYSGSKFYPFK